VGKKSNCTLTKHKLDIRLLPNIFGLIYKAKNKVVIQNNQCGFTFYSVRARGVWLFCPFAGSPLAHLPPHLGRFAPVE